MQQKYFHAANLSSSECSHVGLLFTNKELSLAHDTVDTFNNNNYIYHAIINALSAHMMHINLDMIFYTHVEHSPTKTIYIYKKKAKHHTHTNDCSRNWVLILVRMEIL